MPDCTFSSKSSTCSAYRQTKRKNRHKRGRKKSREF